MFPQGLHTYQILRDTNVLSLVFNPTTLHKKIKNSVVLENICANELIVNVNTLLLLVEIV